MALKDVEYGIRAVNVEDTEEEKSSAKVKIQDGEQKINRLIEKDSSKNNASQKVLEIYNTEISKRISNPTTTTPSIIDTTVKTSNEKIDRACEILKEKIGERNPEDYILFHVYTGPSVLDQLLPIEEKYGITISTIEGEGVAGAVTQAVLSQVDEFDIAVIPTTGIVSVAPSGL